MNTCQRIPTLTDILYLFLINLLFLTQVLPKVIDNELNIVVIAARTAVLNKHGSYVINNSCKYLHGKKHH